jgi:hypothetical protein
LVFKAARGSLKRFVLIPSCRFWICHTVGLADIKSGRKKLSRRNPHLLKAKPQKTRMLPLNHNLTKQKWRKTGVKAQKTCQR